MSNGEYLKAMGKKMRAIRLSKKMTLRQLAVLCELDYTSIGRIECGEYSSRLLTLKVIADKLEVDVKDFL